MLFFVDSSDTVGFKTARQDNELHGRRCKHLYVRISIHYTVTWTPGNVSCGRIRPKYHTLC